MQCCSKAPRNEWRTADSRQAGTRTTGKTPLRILMVTDAWRPQINGVVTSICLFKQALIERGHEVYVFAPTPEHPINRCFAQPFPSTSPMSFARCR